MIEGKQIRENSREFAAILETTKRCAGALLRENFK